MSNKDYYSILGVQRGASDADLKRQYKELAKKYHPDRQQGKSDEEKKAAEEKFKEINEAYQVLSDPQKKQMYDTYGTVDGMGGGMSAEEAMAAFMRHMGAGMFGHGGFESFFDMGGGSQGVVRGTDIKLSVKLTLSDVINGAKKDIAFNRWVMCKDCNGTGSSDGKKKVCPDCNGSGRRVTTRRQGFATFQNITVCQHCGGSGHILTNPCHKCGGDGLVRVVEKMTIDIPVGVVNNSYITMESVGNEPAGGGMKGDVHIVFSIEYPDGFSPSSSDPFDVNMSMFVPILDCLTGGDVQFVHADGRKLMFKLPECTPDGSVIRLRNEGIRRPDGSRGRLNVIVHHKMPKTLALADVKAINKLKEHKTFKQ